MSVFVSDMIPLRVGSRWLYRVDYKLFGRDVKVQVMDRKADYYLVKFQAGSDEWSVILKSNVDLFVAGYSQKGINTLRAASEFQDVPKTMILKSPVVQGNAWQNNFGNFQIVKTGHRLKIGDKVITDCIQLHLKDSTNAENDFFFKEGVGVVYASLYIDNLGKVNVTLKKFN